MSCIQIKLLHGNKSAHCAENFVVVRRADKNAANIGEMTAVCNSCQVRIECRGKF